jgi:hypothetical protein
MPRPGYLICAASGSLDQYTEAVSLFNIIESIGVSAVNPRGDGTIAIPPPMSMRIIAVWLKGENDAPEDRFETEIAGYAPVDGRPLFRADFPAFQFGNPVRRFIVPAVVFPPTTVVAPGLMRFECGIRREGDASWLVVQQYFVVVVEAADEGETPQLPAEPPESSS